MYGVAALAEGPCAFEAGRAGADDEHGIAGGCARNELRMPAAAPRLADGRVLGAAHGRHGEVAADAHVAADAFANVIKASFFDFSRQKRVRDRWSCGADHVENAAPDLRQHG